MYEVSDGKVTHPNGDMKASFDLTDFGSADNFQRFLDEFDIGEHDTETSVRTNEEVWHNDRVAVRTSNNPITGEDPRGMRHDEEGYASYIHIIGEEDAVREVYEYITTSNDTFTDGNHALGEYVV